ncbi:MAG: radical SAM protein [Peptococcaceae bacterium BICA1-7]|nr:MAG: radical SAM protein [Peptococcaceae bacterium BICA1-7]HBV98274.1 radical SAM protein [Desulfotomaculum sp.]
MGYERMTASRLRTKKDEALSLLAKCNLCPRECGADRLNNKPGICRSGRTARVSSSGPHFGEERPLVGRYGSGTIFFANCNLGCVFCQNYDISHQGEGTEVTPGELAGIMLQLQDSGCHNINLVSPTHYVPQMLEALEIALEGGLTVPLVYNTGGYDSVHLLRILDGVVDIYMPDIKFGDDGAGEKYLGVKDYFTAAREAVREMHRQVGDLKTNSRGIAVKGLLVRHLVLPGNLARSERILSFLAGEISKETYINIMDQYYPAHLAFGYEELSRRITGKEYKEVLAVADRLGLKNLL